jgi:nitrate reductase gamma subunit
MFYNVTLFLSVAIFLCGIVYKISGWVCRQVGPVNPRVGTRDRIAVAISGLGRTLFSGKLFVLISAVFTEVFLQFHFLRKKKNYYVWCMHMCLFWGFILLILMHALDAFISEQIFVGYFPTLNPYFFLRDLFGFMVLIGLVMAFVRRFWFRSTLPPRSITDHLGFILLTVIILSGFFLGATKITSPTIYQEMVEDYGDNFEVEEAVALEAYWVKTQGLASSRLFSEIDAEVLAAGAEIHQQSCVDCHADAQWAFVGYTLSRLIRPFALVIDRLNFNKILWYIHFLACFVGLAYLPFNRMFHVIATPVSMLANAVSKSGSLGPAALANKYSLERDACLHGGGCNLGCLVHNKRDFQINEQKTKEPLQHYLGQNFKINKDGS